MLGDTRAASHSRRMIASAIIRSQVYSLCNPIVAHCVESIFRRFEKSRYRYRCYTNAENASLLQCISHVFRIPVYHQLIRFHQFLHLRPIKYTRRRIHAYPHPGLAEKCSLLHPLCDARISENQESFSRGWEDCCHRTFNRYTLSAIAVTLNVAARDI